MPSRRDRFMNSNIYHIFNKTIDHKSIFEDIKLAWMFLDLIKYYRSNKTRVRYSHFRRMPPTEQSSIENRINNPKYFRVEILAFCIMGNHFHLLLKQLDQNGIVRFMSDILNSLTRYYNILNERKGPIFLPQFRSRQVINDEQLKHVSRYIHLNPYSSGIVKNLKELETYELSSFREFLNPNPDSLSNPKPVIDLFNGNQNRYKKFVYDNAEHQKTLESVKYSQKWI